MGKGRKPTPVAVKLLKGNPGKRPLKDVPQAKGELPECPLWFDDIARGEWERLAGDIPWVRGADASMFEVYCVAYSQWRRALKKQGEPGNGFVASTSAGSIKRHPLVAIAVEAANQMKAAAAELGLTPCARTRLGTPMAKSDSKFKKFVG